MTNHVVMPKITIGADPELFVRHIDTGRIVSAHDLLPGTKDRPHKVNCGAIQVDGVAAEFNIEPAMASDQFYSYCDAVMSELRDRLGAKYELVVEPTALFDPRYFDTLPHTTRELGCNPDFNAWTGQVNDPPSTPKGDKVMRTAAGHIHIGWTDKQDVKDPDVFADCCVVARQMDYYLGMYSLLWDPDPTRRMMYGKAGSMRPKPYGVEYRPLSNMWLLTPQLQHWVWDAAFQGIQSLFNGSPMETEFGNLAQRVIDDNQIDWTNDPEIKKVMLCTGMGMPPLSQKSGKPKRMSSHTYQAQPVGNAFTINTSGWSNQ